MRIIIDGNDGVGKTQLAKRLQADLDIKSYIHLSYKDPTDVDFYFNIMKKENVIFDRSFIDEPIYSKVLDRKCSLEHYDIAKLFKLLELKNYIVIICHTEKKFNKPNENVQVLENKREIDLYFRDIAIQKNFIYFDPIKENYNHLLAQLKKFKDAEVALEEEYDMQLCDSGFLNVLKHRIARSVNDGEYIELSLITETEPQNKMVKVSDIIKYGYDDNGYFIECLSLPEGINADQIGRCYKLYVLAGSFLKVVRMLG
jgi:deoxyadenosine/deoxycytidine kinase